VVRSIGLVSSTLLLALVAVANAGEAGRLYAQAQGYSDGIRQWFRDQRVPGKTVSCCSEADGEETSEDIRGDDYWIRNAKFPEWTKVPKEAVITEQVNDLGRPVVWWGLGEEGQFIIRCFSPGAKS